VADTGNHTIRRVTPAGVVTTVAGLAGNQGSADGSGGEARFTSPRGLAVSGAGSVYVADTWNHAIREGIPAAHTLTLGVPDGTPNPVASNGMVSLAVDASDSWNHALDFTWTASCPGLGGDGLFSNPDQQSPTWTAPANTTGSSQACTLSVSVADGEGLTEGDSVNVTVAAQEVCPYAITLAPTSATATGGSGSVTVNTGSTCAWSATSDASWLIITGASNGVGTATVDFSVEATDIFGSRTGTLTVAGHAVPVTQTGLGYTHYFAEGATIGGFFETRFSLLNTDEAATATVSLEFSLKDTTTTLTFNTTIAPGARKTIDVGTLAAGNPALAALASAEFSTVIRSDVPLVTDRTMFWDASGYGSHAETSVGSPASIWYLAEGATIGNFALYYLIQNPNPEPITFQVTYLLAGPTPPVVRSYSIGANTRTNIAVHAEPGLEDVEVSAIIESPADKPIIVERAMYLTAGGLLYGAGHESAGIRAPQTNWYFAEGATGSFFDLFILIGNPTDVDAQITATFLFDDGTTCTTPATVGAKSRYNIWVDMTVIPGCPRSLADAAVSTTISADQPVVAERSMWWPGPTPGSWAEVHNAPGATTTGTTWGLADGEQGGPRGSETFILIANTSSYAGTARVTLEFEDGTTLQKVVVLPANSRTNVPVGAPSAAGGFGAAVQDKRFGATVESLPVPGQPGPAQIVVERAMYSNGPGAAFWAAGTDLLGTKIQ
jgi:hypothetical protein